MNKKLHTQASPSPLRLDRYFLKSVNFTLYKGYDRAKLSAKEIQAMEPPPMEIGGICEHNPENNRQWRIELELKLLEPEDGNFPYKVEATLVGYFTVEDEYTGDAERLARISGPSLLYSSARDLVDTVTGRSPFPAMTLPSVMFGLVEQPQLSEPKELGVGQPAKAEKTTKPGSKKTTRKASKKR